MALKLIATYSKRLGLPGYSSHQFSVCVETEISNIDDVMEFLVAGASAVQVGTANFYDPTLSTRLVDQLQETVAAEGCQHVSELIGSLKP